MQQPPHGWGQQQQGYGPPPSHGYVPVAHGYAQPPPPQRQGGNQAVFIVLAILGLVLMVPVGICLVAGFIGASAAHSSTSPSRSQGSQGTSVEAKTPARRSGPDVTVSASQLFSDYQANEVAADAKYKGKQVLVTGSVMSIDKDFADDIVVMIATSNPYMSIHAELKDGQSAQAGALAKGQTVKVQCEGRGMIIGSPMLSNCFIK